MLSAVNGEPYCPNLLFLCRFYEGDIDEFQLEAQLSLFATHFREVNSYNSQVSICDILKYFKDLATAQKKLMSQVFLVVKFLLLAPCTNAVYVYLVGFYLITNCKVALGLKRLPEFCQDVYVLQ